MPVSSSRNRASKRGFTLIELLVVIAIIAILAAILFPVFAQARAKARQTACLSNTKQLGLALNMYAQDYDETLPPQNHNYNWAEMNIENLIHPYTKNMDIWACPSSRTAVSEAQYNAAPKDRAWKVFINGQEKLASIGVNVSMFPYGDGTQLWGGPGSLADSSKKGQVANLAQLARVADTVCFMDSRWPGVSAWPNQIGVNLGVPGKTRHSNTINIVFADGHAKAITGTPYNVNGTYNPPLGPQEKIAAGQGAINYRVLLDKTKYVWDPADPGAQ